MTSKALTTEITRVEASEDEEKEPPNEKQVATDESKCQAQFSDESEDENYIDDKRYDTNATHNDITDEAMNALEELLKLEDNFGKLEIIQRKRGKHEVNDQLISHVIITGRSDDIVDEQQLNQLNELNPLYIFEDKTKLLKESEKRLKQKSAKNSLKSDVQINKIPKTFEEFLELIFELKADLIEDEKSRLFFSEETHNRDIRFKSHDSYVTSFIPFVIREFWSALKANFKREAIPFQMCYHKSEDKSNEMVLSHIRNKCCTQSTFKFGQIVVIKYRINQNESEVESYFGVVLEVIPKLIDKSNELLSKPLIKSQTESEENDFIFEEIVIYCKPFAQTFESVSVIPLVCVQKYLLEARIVYELKDQRFNKLFEQILKPNFKFGISGLSVNLDHRKELFDIQKDSIQKSYEVCCLPPMDGFSSFVAVYGGPKTGKTEVLIETALQLLRTADEKVNKLIVIISGVNRLDEIIKALKREQIKVYHIVSEGDCLSQKNSDLKRLIKKMDRDTTFNDIVGKDYSIEQILKYYSEDGTTELNKRIELSVKDQYVKEIIDKRVIEKLMSDSEVIIGSIASVMNNETFNSIYNKNCDFNIKCGLIDDAHHLTETELLTLFYTGVQSFVLFGNITENPKSYEKCESFLKRYVKLYRKNFIKDDPKNYSVLYLNDTIESLQRYAKNKNNSQNNRQNKQFGPKNPKQRINEYRSHSNYGSEYFNRKDRFKDYKPFQNEDKIKTFGSNNNSFNRYGKPHNEYRNGGRGQSRPNHNQNQMTSQRPPNAMIDGIGSQLAYGGRRSYMSGNSHHFSNDLNRNGVSNANNDPNANNYPSNGSQFVSNPTRLQNYNSF